MLKKIFMLSLLLSFAVSTFSTVSAMYRRRGDDMLDAIKGNGNVVVSSRSLTAGPYLLKINNISLISSPSMQIHITPGDRPQVSLITDENVIAVTDITINEGTHTIELSSFEKISPTSFTVEITAPIKGFTGQGAFNFDVTLAEISEFNLSAKGNCTGKINLGAVLSSAISIQGQNKLKILGRSDTFNLTIHGNGNTDACEVISHNCNLSCNGQGKVFVFADNSLNLNIGGNWECNYAGNPPQIAKSVLGLCKIKKLA